jgi:hypothetical protein
MVVEETEMHSLMPDTFFPQFLGSFIWLNRSQWRSRFCYAKRNLRIYIYNNQQSSFESMKLLGNWSIYLEF